MGLSLFPYQLLILIIKTQEKSGTVPFFKFFEFRQSSYFKSGDSPSRKIQQSAFASLGFLLRGTVLKDRPPLKQGLSLFLYQLLFLHHQTQKLGTVPIGTVPFPLSQLLILHHQNSKNFFINYLWIFLKIFRNNICHIFICNFNFQIHNTYIAIINGKSAIIRIIFLKNIYL